MRIPRPFVKLPLTFDAERLATEISQFGEGDWRAHPQGYAGNSSLILVSSGGGENDSFSGPMQPSPRLQQTPYIRQIMARFDTVIGRSRLMRLAPGAVVSRHTDSHYFWRDRLRIHIPIISDPKVAFHCDDEVVHMGAGESWTFNNWLPHSVENHSGIARIHLVIDTVGSAPLWRMIHGLECTPRHVAFAGEDQGKLRFETFQGFGVLPPAELRADLEQLVEDIAEPDVGHGQHSVGQHSVGQQKQQVRLRTEDFLHDWHSQWVVDGPTLEGLPGFSDMLAAYRHDIDQLPDRLTLISNSESFKEAVNYTLDAALAPENLPQTTPSRTAPDAAPGKLPTDRPRFDRPVFIMAAPRSGSTLLFETLALNRDLWSVGDESHGHFERISTLRPSGNHPSNRLTANQATPEVREALLNAFAANLVSSDGKMFSRYPQLSRPLEVRFLEKTPKNALRIPFILEAFPDARFIFLFRDARQNISSLLDSWRSGRYVTYPNLPGWPRDNPWSHLLIPGWQDLAGKSLAQVVTQQWLVTNQTILDDLQPLPRESWCAIEYDALIADTANELKRLCDFSEIIFGPRMHEVASRPLKPSKYTLTAPQPDKWKKNAAELEAVVPATELMMARLRRLV